MVDIDSCSANARLCLWNVCFSSILKYLVDILDWFSVFPSFSTKTLYFSCKSKYLERSCELLNWISDLLNAVLKDCTSANYALKDPAKILDWFQYFLHTVLFMQICVERSCELDWFDFLSTFSRHAAIHSQRLFKVIPVFFILVLNIILEISNILNVQGWL